MIYGAICIAPNSICRNFDAARAKSSLTLVLSCVDGSDFAKFNVDGCRSLRGAASAFEARMRAWFVIVAMQVDVKGLDNVVTWLDKISKTVPDKLFHASSNFVIDGDGDEATMNCISQAIQITDDGIKHFAFGYYKDMLVKTAAGWRLKDHKLNLMI